MSAQNGRITGELLSGDEYLASLRDARAVYLYGERIRDVTEHPAFRNSARSIARLYDALHDPAQRELLTIVDRLGIRTHRFFAPSYSAQELLAARDAIAAWARLTYGFMGRTPDYKAAFMATLGADPEFYAPYAESARTWYRKYSTKGLFLNHVIVNPPVDRNRPVHEVADVYLHVVRETDAGAYVSGAKMLATASALTHATFVAQNSSVTLEAGKAEDYALVFLAPMDTPGTKLLSRASYEQLAHSPFDHPLSSRFDENDAVLVFDDAFIPWENFLVYRDVEHLMITIFLPWFFVTPIFYTLDALPGLEGNEWVADFIYYVNFVTPFVEVIRDPIFFGELPTLGGVVYCVVAGTVSLALGVLAARRMDDRVSATL